MTTPLVKGLSAFGTLLTAAGIGTAIYLNTGTTIGNKLSTQGFKLINNLNDYRFNLFANKDSVQLKSAISVSSINHLNDTTRLEKWCNDKLKEWASNDKNGVIFENAKQWCTQPEIKTLRDKIRGNLYAQNEWQGKYTEFATPSSGNSFLNALKEQFKAVDFNAQKSDGGEKLKEWCNLSLDQKIYEIDVTHKTEANINSWCIKKV